MSNKATPIERLTITTVFFCLTAFAVLLWWHISDPGIVFAVKPQNHPATYTEPLLSMTRNDFEVLCPSSLHSRDNVDVYTARGIKVVRVYNSPFVTERKTNCIGLFVFINGGLESFFQGGGRSSTYP